MGLRLNGQLLVTEVGDDKRGRGGSEDGTLSLARKAGETASTPGGEAGPVVFQEHGRITALFQAEHPVSMEGGG